MSKKPFTKIDKVLTQTAKAYHLDEAMWRYKITKVWQEVASGFVAEAGQVTRAMDFKRGVLVVASLSRNVAYQIRLLAQKIIDALNETLGRRLVYALQIEY